MLSSYLLFSFLCSLAYVSPGPDWVIISRNTFVSRKNGFLAALGVQFGLFFHMALGFFSTTFLYYLSKNTLDIVQIIGGLYITWLGLSAFKTTETKAKSSNSNKKSRNVFLSGLLANILNPKAALFFISILPQFIDQNSSFVLQVIILSSIATILGLIWWTILVLSIEKLYSLTQNEKIKKKIDMYTGLILIILGLVFCLKAFYSIIN